MRRRVVITGIGVVSGAGIGNKAFQSALRIGKRCFTRLEGIEGDGVRATHAAICSDVGPGPDDLPAVGEMDRIVHLALLALREALLDAGLHEKTGSDAALVFGTCSGGMLSIERHYRALHRGEARLDEALLFAKRYYTPAKVLAWAAGASGPVMSVVTACAAGTGAIAQGADLVRAGISEMALVGGGDTFALSTLAGFDALKATCEGICTPFSQNIGLNLGEGAAFLVLESLSHATSRGVPIQAEIIGSGLSNDAYHATSPDPSTKGQVTAMSRTLRDAGLYSSQIDYINAHGTGTRANDPIESRAIARMLLEHAAEVPVSSTKSMIGHCLGAAGALEAAACILAGKAGFLPPTAGFTEPREGCGLADYVPVANRGFTGRIVLSNSFGFGGNNACLLLDLAPDEHTPIAKAAYPNGNPPVITGYGLVHALGLGIAPLVETNRCGIFAIDRFKVNDASFQAGLVPPLDLRSVDRRLSLRGMDRSSLYTTLAARLALKEANLDMRPAVTADIGMVLGLATGPTEGESRHLEAFFESGFKLERLDAFPFVVQNEVVGHAARALMLKGHNTVLSQGWGTGLAALISSAVAVSQSHAEVILAAAADELTERVFLDGCEVGIFGPGTGVVPGEGAATLVVEDAQAASFRGAFVLAEIIGYAMATDTVSPSAATGEAIKMALSRAVERSGVDPCEVTQVAASLNGSPTDALERRAIRETLPSASLLSLSGRLGFAEAALPLMNLAYLLATCPPRTLMACTSLSREGFANAVILRCRP